MDGLDLERQFTHVRTCSLTTRGGMRIMENFSAMMGLCLWRHISLQMATHTMRAIFLTPVHRFAKRTAFGLRLMRTPEDMPLLGIDPDPQVWPDVRLAKAFRRYAVTWAVTVHGTAFTSSERRVLCLWRTGWR